MAIGGSSSQRSQTVLLGQRTFNNGSYRVLADPVLELQAGWITTVKNKKGQDDRQAGLSCKCLAPTNNLEQRLIPPDPALLRGV